MITKTPSRSGKVQVTFTLPASIWADAIHLVGDFNNWNAAAAPMELDEANWSITLELDAHRIYHYQYVIDGSERVNDWHADYFTMQRNGAMTSVVMVAPDLDCGHLASHRAMQ
jgi:1,4-alpha-glucan branching enzyme